MLPFQTSVLLGSLSAIISNVISQWKSLEILISGLASHSYDQIRVSFDFVKKLVKSVVCVANHINWVPGSLFRFVNLQ